MNTIKSMCLAVLVVFFALPVFASTDNTRDNNEDRTESITAEVLPYVGKVAKAQTAADEPQAKTLEAVKAAIKDRSKATGSLDVYDGKTEKVRNLDLMSLQPTIGTDGDHQVVTGDFRDTKSGDVVTVEIKGTEAGGAFEIKDTVVTAAKAPEAVQDEKKDFTDAEIQAFMNEYISIQAQTTGTFDLYDEKLAKMRNLELVKLDEKVRRYGIIAISTAEFKDKNSGDKVMVDVNTENKGGLSVSAMRIKGISKAAK